MRKKRRKGEKETEKETKEREKTACAKFSEEHFPPETRFKKTIPLGQTNPPFRGK